MVQSGKNHGGENTYCRLKQGKGLYNYIEHPHQNFPEFPPPPLNVSNIVIIEIAFAWLSGTHVSQENLKNAMIQTYFVLSSLNDGRHKNGIDGYFRYHIPSGDVGTARCKQWR